MRPKFLFRENTRSLHVQLDTGKCKACWKCLKGCQKGVIGKVDLPWHKHVLLVEPDACTGCLKCVNICQEGAFSNIDGTKQAAAKQQTRTLNNFLINNLLLIFGLVMIFSGLVLQLGFHMGGSGGHRNNTHLQFGRIPYEELRAIDTDKMVCGFNYHVWSDVHKIVIVFFSVLMIYHTTIHWKWYKGIIRKNLVGKNKQVIMLSILFLLVAVTGLVPWYIDLAGNTGTFRMVFIEIHDKLTLILIVLLFLHVTRRAKWFAMAYAKLKR